ncbi:MAG: glucosaminidase domain-containing protein [Paludibacter sp.]|jgi:LysM repeat protein|nr:glucosaminidase domain-containing protein [Paludibacter sp.]
MIPQKQKTFLLLGVCATFFLSSAQNINPQYSDYINKYNAIAREQQKQYGIPASIILAQGLLESGAGNSPLAVNANNHFGIKCAEWQGETVYYDDDNAQECFRKYKKVKDSYTDHSLFLKNRSRYASLFELNITNYRDWALGLKAAGYATDPAYAGKLIALIENYKLYEFDSGKKNKSEKSDLSEETTDETAAYKTAKMGDVDIWYRHKVYKTNGVKYVIAQTGDTYGAIADEFNLSERKIRNFNEDESNEDLPQGTKIYLRSKKNRAEKNATFYKVKQGDSMYSIAQEYAIKTIKLYQINKMDYSQGVSLGQKIKLR